MAFEHMQASTNQLLEDPARRKKTIAVVVATLFVVLVVSVILVSAFVLKKEPKCQIVDSLTVDIADKKPIASKGNTALVRFAGYLRMWRGDTVFPDPNRFLELNLKKVDYKFFSNDNIRLALDGDCATVNLELNRNDKSGMFFLTMINVDSKTGNTNFTKCTKSPVENVNFPIDSYYSCESERHYFCIPTESGGQARGDIPRVELTFSVLEIELDGDPKSIAKGKFEKKRVTC